MFFINNFYCRQRQKNENEDICQETLKPCCYENCNHTLEKVQARMQGWTPENSEYQEQEQKI